MNIKNFLVLIAMTSLLIACGSTESDDEGEAGEMMTTAGEMMTTAGEMMTTAGEMMTEDGCPSYCQNMEEAGCFEFGPTIGFDSADSCLTACANYSTAGADGDINGNTLQCRAQHASLAVMFKDVNNGDIHCTHAGIDGGGICVDVRPTTEQELAANYCSKITQFCPEQAATAFTDCAAEVTTLLNNGDYRTDGGAADTTGLTVQCLTNTAVLSGIVDQALCTAALPGSESCVD